MAKNIVLKIEHLSKQYGSLAAVDGISFNVYKGEVFGLLGENGAGKTTTLEMIEGLRKPTKGKISVLGHDIHDGLNNIKERIGVQLQSSAYYNFLSLREILDLFASFYKEHADPDTLLEMVGLTEKANSYINALSGGQKQRFSIIASLINNPEIVFLDEPTTGLDPIARRHLWEIIAIIKKQGKTIILTTHYMEEAEVLCDRIALMDKGKIIAMDDTYKLIERAKSPYKISFITSNLAANDLTKLKTAGELKEVAGKKNNFELKLTDQNKLNIALGIISKKLPESLAVERASLEDVFIELTGAKIEQEENA